MSKDGKLSPWLSKIAVTGLIEIPLKKSDATVILFGRERSNHHVVNR